MFVGDRERKREGEGRGLSLMGQASHHSVFHVVILGVIISCVSFHSLLAVFDLQHHAAFYQSQSTELRTRDIRLFFTAKKAGPEKKTDKKVRYALLPTKLTQE